MKPTGASFNFFKLAKRVKRHLRVWGLTSLLHLEIYFQSRPASLMYIMGKFIRFFFFWWLLDCLFSRGQVLAGYSFEQLFTLYLVFNLFDMAGQALFRGVYEFRSLIISGDFDLKLAKPLSPLFQALVSHTDFLDLPLFVLVIWLLVSQGFSPTIGELLLFGILAICGFLVITAIHIIAVSMGIVTAEVVHVVRIYRDVSLLGRIPIDVYLEPIRGILTFIVPLAVIVTFPTKALIGALDWQMAFISLLIGPSFFVLSWFFWRYALKQYSSAGG